MNKKEKLKKSYSELDITGKSPPVDDVPAVESSHTSVQSRSCSITHCGFIAIVGRPNVGKSTLLNALLERQLAIATRKPQTTRHTMLGVDCVDNTQMIYIDTPGIHQAQDNPLNRYMNKIARQSLHDVDLILWVLAGTQWRDDDAWMLKLLQQRAAESNLLIVINKVDLVRSKQDLLPCMDKLRKSFPQAEVMAICANKKQDIQPLKRVIMRYMPQGSAYFPENQLTNRSKEFIAAEFIREQLILQLGQELPYVSTVTIDKCSLEKSCLHIAAVIWVAKDSQKPMVIGKGGQTLKRISTSSRLRIQAYFKTKVYLQVWVKIKTNWMDDAASLQQLGFDQE